MRSCAAAPDGQVNSAIAITGTATPTRPAVVRLRIRGGDRLTAFIVSTIRRYQVERLRWQFVHEGLWQARPKDARPPIHLDLLPGDDGTWDAALDEFWSTWLPRARPAFDDVLARSE